MASYTTRCNAAERKALEWYCGYAYNRNLEPVLGTLEQRLDIIIKNHGGRLRPPRPTKAELATLEVLS